MMATGPHALRFPCAAGLVQDERTTLTRQRRWLAAVCQLATRVTRSVDVVTS